MLLKVKHDELKNVKDVMIKDSALLDDEINILKEQIEKLRTIWQGQDAKMFCDNVYNYVERMKTIPTSMRILGDFINKANNRYAESDEMFSRELQTEVDNYE